MGDFDISAHFYQPTTSSKLKVSKCYSDSNPDSKLMPWHQTPSYPRYNDEYNLNPEDPNIVRNRSAGGWPQPVIPITPAQITKRMEKMHWDKLEMDYYAQMLPGMKTGGGSILDAIKVRKDRQAAQDRENDTKKAHLVLQGEWENAMKKSVKSISHGTVDAPNAFKMSILLFPDLKDELQNRYEKLKPLLLVCDELYYSEEAAGLAGTKSSYTANSSTIQFAASSARFSLGTSMRSRVNTNEPYDDTGFTIPPNEYAFMKSSYFPKAGDTRFEKMYTRWKYKETANDAKKLFEACVYDDYEVVRGLLQLAPNLLNEEDSHKNSPLCIAALHDSAVVLELLLYTSEGRAIIDKKNKHGLTPVDLACARKHRESVLTLLAFGAEPSWDHASTKFRKRIEEEWTRRKSHSLASNLYSAVVKGALADVQSLILNDGVDVNVSDPNAKSESFSLLHCAVSASNPKVEVVNFLLEKGADLFHVDIDGDSALHVACGRSEASIKDIIRLLLENDSEGKMLRAENGRGRLPLFNAAIAGNLAVCKLLMDEPNVDTAEMANRTDSYGQTCMYYANLAHAKEVTAYFVERGLRI